VLSRTLYLDIGAASLTKPEARRFVREYLGDSPLVRVSDGVVAVEPSQRIHLKFTRP
jgi:hypothetical protein